MVRTWGANVKGMSQRMSGRVDTASITAGPAAGSVLDKGVWRSLMAGVGVGP